jgi:hypothetical protein
MTPTHCIFCEDLSILYAQDVVPGKTKILVLNEANELIPVVVDDLTMVCLFHINPFLNASFIHVSIINSPFEIRKETPVTLVSILVLVR